MKRIFVAMVVVLILFGGYVAVSHFSGGAFPTLGLPLGGDRGTVRRISTSFLEDIQFKDFESAAKYHSPEDQKTVDIPYLIQRLFLVPPEQLDLMEYEVLFARIDSTGERARVKTRVKTKLLVEKKIKDQELMLYFKRDDAASKWFMKLEDSLRQAEKDDDKKG